MHFIRRSRRGAVGLTLGMLCLVSAAGAVTVPPELREWESWVLDGHESHACPWLTPGQVTDNNRVCAWPSVLELQVDAHSGRFSQRWQAATETWLALPGSVENWPEAVTINGAPAPVVVHDKAPALRVPSGAYVVAGAFRWTRRPESLAVPASVALVALAVDGVRVALPQRSDDRVVLGAPAQARQENRVDLRVFRQLDDVLPARLTTRLQLSVAGEARELRLPQALPDGFAPIAIESELAARMDPDNTLRVQVRPGAFTLTLEARGPSPVADVRSVSHAAPWPADEVWSFQAEDRLRVVAIEGLTSVDPNQANVPSDWHGLPAYLFHAASVLHIAERSRGLTAQDANELQLQRTEWLSFSGKEFTIVDAIRGRLHQGWRLDMAEPYELQSARVGEEPLLVTRGQDAKLTGIELRAPELMLTAVSRLASTPVAAPATGWHERFAHVSGELIVAPGFHLLAAIGPDAAPQAWLDRWHLIDIFAVLLIATVAWRVLGLATAAIAAAAIVLTYQEPDAPTWLWLNLLAAIALLRALPEGRLRRIVGGYRMVSLVILLAALIPFAIVQIRLAVYPQLEASEGAAPVMVLAARAVPQSLEAARVDEVAEKMPNEPPPKPAERFMRQRPVTIQGVPLSKQLGSLSASHDRQEIVVTGMRKMASYEPGAITQAGPGLPAWSYHAYGYSWNGPVEATETVRFVISPPWVTRAWRVLGIALSVLLALQLATGIVPRLPRWWPRRWLGAAALILLSLGLGGAPPATAATTPDPTVLGELRTKLLAPARCAPDCADVMAAEVTVTANRVSVVLTVSALDSLGLALPSGDPNWGADLVQVDGSAAGAVYRDATGVRYVSLSRGRHVVRLEGPLPAADAFSLEFPLPPHVVDVNAAGWDVGGIADRRLVSGALEIARRRVVRETSGVLARQAEFPPFVSVARLFHISHDWTIGTTVERVAPRSGAFTVKIPLLPQEAVTTDGLDVSHGMVTVGIPSGEGSAEYQSSLPMSDTIELAAANDPSRTERWLFDVSPTWHADFVGPPSVLPEDSNGGWLFEYYPRPGERLQVKIVRPAAVVGSTVAFDHVWLENAIGKRSTDSSLRLAYRSTQGGRQVLKLPADAVVTSTMSDGAAVTVRPEHGELSLPMLPGSHNWTINWQRPVGTTLLARSPPVDLSGPSSNLSVSLQVPRDRWVLYAFGPGVGPTILYWGELLLFVVVAWGLGRSGWTPLATRDWLLLGLGLSTFSWLVFGLFVVFVATFQWRALNPPVTDRVRFNARQIALGALALTAVLALVAAVPRGLLAQPDMRIVGADAGTFGWFIDKAAAAVPTPGVLSVSIWWYKIAMLAWALWLSFALTRWIKWAWQTYTKDGLWRAREMAAPAAPSVPP